MGIHVGKQSIKLENPVYIIGSASVVGKKEGEGPLGLLFDRVEEDDLFGGKCWEEAESNLQKNAVELALQKTGLQAENIDFLFGGDLLGQSIATSYGIASFQIPFFGLYGACSTCGESLALGSMAIAGGFAEKVMCVTSSHYASAEKEFRFPLDYGSQRPLSASWTVTGSGAFVLSRNQTINDNTCSSTNLTESSSNMSGSVSQCESPGVSGAARAHISAISVGKITDFGIKDSMNMGACMAPAAAETLQQHFIDFNSQPDDYDKIITGDLGKVGKRVLLDLMRERGYNISDRHMDCGIEIYDGDSQDTHAGGSGCGCCASTLSAYILKQLEEGNWKRVLFMPTGALLSKTSYNEGKTVPGICHALVLESCSST